MSDVSKITRAHCNRCGHDTKHEIVMERRTVGSEIVDPYQGIDISWSTTFLMLECCGCEEVMLKRSFWFSEADDTETKYYPPRVSRRRPSWVDTLPADYTSLLDEIYSALHADSRSLAMMGLRTLIDLFISRKLEDSPRFEEGLKELVRQNYVTQESSKIIEAAVEAGHAAAHRAHKPTAEQLNAVIDIVENLIQHDLLTESAEVLRRTTPSRPPRKKKIKKVVTTS